MKSPKSAKIQLFEKLIGARLAVHRARLRTSLLSIIFRQPPSKSSATRDVNLSLFSHLSQKPLELFSEFKSEMQSLKQPSPCPLKGIERPGSNNTARLLIGHAKHELPPSLVGECNAVLHEIIELVATLALLKLEVFVLWASY